MDRLNHSATVQAVRKRSFKVLLSNLYLLAHPAKSLTIDSNNGPPLLTAKQELKCEFRALLSLIMATHHSLGIAL
jgi:hypothetical protein